jgi:hypothetical protein
MAGSATGGTAIAGSATGGTASGQAGSQTSAGSGGAGGTGGAGQEANKVVLFDGSPGTFKEWVSVRSGAGNPWQANADGTMTVQSNAGDIQSKAKFNDVFVHVEYMTPKIVGEGTSEQQRGNSGVYLKGSYEAQILDTYGLPPTNGGCGAIYGISAPFSVACFQAEEWNVYEIEFRAQVCSAQGQKTQNARFVEVTLNGELVQQDVDVPGTTQAGQAESCEPRGLLLQDHSTVVPVSFRNIWAIPRD